MSDHPQPYPRPAIPPDTFERAVQYAVKATANKGTGEIRNFITMILVENARLTAECNDHRRARGYEEIKPQ